MDCRDTIIVLLGISAVLMSIEIRNLYQERDVMREWQTEVLQKFIYPDARCESTITTARGGASFTVDYGDAAASPVPLPSNEKHD